MTSVLQLSALVEYKSHPARVAEVSDKIVIVLPDGKTKKVREKDICFLHPGPVADLAALSVQTPDVMETWELLQGEQVSLAELAELISGTYSPVSAWQVWHLLRDGRYFSGDPDAIQVHTPERLSEIEAARVQKQQAKLAWQDLLDHIQAARLTAADRQQLVEVERVALCAAARSRILSACKVPNTPADAHQFLVRCGYWPAHENPWPRRHHIVSKQITCSVPSLAEEPRLDLTGLSAWAIDDVGNQDPDDAISLEGDYLWVHIADAAALVAPDSPLDLAARDRASTLYLPEQTHWMLPAALIQQLGMGLAEHSPALSVGCRFDGAQLCDIRIESSRVQVQRITYEEVDQRLQEPEFAALVELTQAYRDRRAANQAIQLDLPEVAIKLEHDQVQIRSGAKTPSRDLVADAMIMAGEAVALYAQQHDIAIPYAMQPAPDTLQHPQTLAEKYAYRRCLKPSRTLLQPEPHAGLGLTSYTRCTSPLRRYADLVVHQQLRAHLRDQPLRTREELKEAILALDETNSRNRRAERHTNLHWKLVYLQQQPDWQGEAVIVALDERKTTLLIPSLALETRIRRQRHHLLDTTLRVRVQSTDLAQQDVSFHVI